MKRLRIGLAAAALFVVVALPNRARAAEPDPDPWLGPDKALHFAASGTLAIGGYALGAAIFDGQARPLLLGAALSVTAGVVKESLDLAGLGDPSWKDVTWNGLGTVTGLAVAWSVSLLVRSLSSRSDTAVSPAGVIAF